MATASTTTVVDHTSDAGFRAWVAEIIAQLLAVGITQTADTGQINTVTVNRPAISTMAGYVILRFNDTLHSTNAIFLKLQFGTGGSATFPSMQIQVGRGSNGSGTLTGLTTTNCACFSNSAPGSTAAPYISRFCYNATQGTLWMVWKIGYSGVEAAGGFCIYRSTDANGDPTSDSTHVITNSTNTTGVTSGGSIQVISHLTSLAYFSAPVSSWVTGIYPFGVTSSLYAGDFQVIPVWQYTPVVGVSNQMAIALRSEVPIGTTVSLAPVGSTPRTYLSVGVGFAPSQYTIGLSASYTTLLLWQ